MRNTAVFALRLALPVLLVLAGTLSAPAAEDLAPPLHGAAAEQKKSFSTGTAFFDDANVGGNLYYFQRKRMRYALSDNHWHNNLDHATVNAGGEFTSGFAGGVLGFDFGAFLAYDLWNSNIPFHEMNFFPWRDPWHADWSDQYVDNGASVHKAHLKAKIGSAWAKAGYFQPTGPGVLGVNWSLFPGTWQGVEAGFQSGGLSMAGAWANEYKAPWYKDTYAFRMDDGTHVAWVWSLGARYAFSEGPLKDTTLEVAYGESRNYLQNAHFKARHETSAWGNPLTFGYQMYAMADSDGSGSANDNFDGIATQHFLFSRYEPGLWTLRLEFTYTRAHQDNAAQKGYFAYRLISAYGASQGALEPWWDTRSDWNHDREKAVFVNVARKFDDLGLAGVEAGVTWCQGWDGRAYGISDRLNEKALAFDLGYTVPSGPLKGVSVKAHYLIYRNGSDQDSWQNFKNAFQDERDFKFLVSIPFSL